MSVDNGKKQKHNRLKSALLCQHGRRSASVDVATREYPVNGGVHTTTSLHLSASGCCWSVSSGDMAAGALSGESSD